MSCSKKKGFEGRLLLNTVKEKETRSLVENLTNLPNAPLIGEQFLRR